MTEIRKPTHDRGAATVEGLVVEARAFLLSKQTYVDFAHKARVALMKDFEAIVSRLTESNHGENDPLVGLRNQMRGLLERFSEVDAICRSLLLQAENPDLEPKEKEHLAEELVAALNALVGLELEGRTAQTRLALSAILRNYQDAQVVDTRVLKFQVEASVARNFNALVRDVRERQVRFSARNDALSADELLGRLVALGIANSDLLAQMGSPLLPFPLLRRPA